MMSVVCGVRGASKSSLRCHPRVSLQLLPSFFDLINDASHSGRRSSVEGRRQHGGGGKLEGMAILHYWTIMGRCTQRSLTNLLKGVLKVDKDAFSPPQLGARCTCFTDQQDWLSHYYHKDEPRHQNSCCNIIRPTGCSRPNGMSQSLDLRVRQ